LKGRGAGARATASAILGDVVRVLGKPASRAGARREVGHSEPARRHQVRIHAAVDALTPERVLQGFRRHGAEPGEIVLSRATAPAPADLPRDGGAGLASELAGSGGHALVLPVI